MTFSRAPFNVLLATALLALSLPAAADTITIESDYWYPYNGAPGATNEGYVIELLREIAAEQGDRIDYRLMDWDNSLARSLSGSVDCAVGGFVDEVPDHANTSQSWGLSETVLFGHAERLPRVRSLQDLRGLRVGAVVGYEYGEDIDTMLEDPQVEVVRVQSSRQAFPHLVMRLVTGKIDVALSDLNVGTAAVKELGLSDRIVLVNDNLAEAEGIYVSCSPSARGRALVARFDEGLSKARANGRLATLLAKYGLRDWEQPSR